MIRNMRNTMHEMLRLNLDFLMGSSFAFLQSHETPGYPNMGVIELWNLLLLRSWLGILGIPKNPLSKRLFAYQRSG